MLNAVVLLFTRGNLNANVIAAILIWKDIFAVRAHGLLLCLKSSLPLDLVNFTCIGLASVLTLDETLHGNI